MITCSSSSSSCLKKPAMSSKLHLIKEQPTQQGRRRTFVGKAVIAPPGYRGFQRIEYFNVEGAKLVLLRSKQELLEKAVKTINDQHRPEAERITTKLVPLLNDLDEHNIQIKLQASKRKLWEGYQTLEMAKKQRVIPPHPIPRQGGRRPEKFIVRS